MFNAVAPMKQKRQMDCGLSGAAVTIESRFPSGSRSAMCLPEEVISGGSKFGYSLKMCLSFNTRLRSPERKSWIFVAIRSQGPRKDIVWKV
jgi:hypothetical protein